MAILKNGKHVKEVLNFSDEGESSTKDSPSLIS
jgi:hypothetical protein